MSYVTVSVSWTLRLPREVAISALALKAMRVPVGTAPLGFALTTLTFTLPLTSFTLALGPGFGVGVRVGMPFPPLTRLRLVSVKDLRIIPLLAQFGIPGLLSSLTELSRVTTGRASVRVRVSTFARPLGLGIPRIRDLGLA